MAYLKKIILSLKELIILNILQYLLIIISALIYYITGHNNVNTFINIYSSLILIPFYIIATIYLYQKNKIPSQSLSKENYYPLISLGISLSCLLNMIIFIFTSPSITTNTNIILLFITSGIIGPIYEEIIFRYIIFNNLKKFNSPLTSILITSIIFALIHINPIKIIFALILGLTTNNNNNKYKNILAPILIHSSANIIALFLTEYNHHILILSIFCLLLSLEIIFNQNNKVIKSWVLVKIKIKLLTNQNIYTII